MIVLTTPVKQQALYASALLLILSLCFSKLSILVFVQALSPKNIDRKIALWVGAVLVIWALSSELVYAFQCQLPRPWDKINSKCINMVSNCHFSFPIHLYPYQPCLPEDDMGV